MMRRMLFLLKSCAADCAARPDCFGSAASSQSDRWGVVQPVGHLTVNEDGEGSNPSAPANSLSNFEIDSRDCLFSPSADCRKNGDFRTGT